MQARQLPQGGYEKLVFAAILFVISPEMGGARVIFKRLKANRRIPMKRIFVAALATFCVSVSATMIAEQPPIIDRALFLGRFRLRERRFLPMGNISRF